MEGGEPTVIVNQEGARTTPSVGGFAREGERLVGQVAKRQAVTNPENTIFSIKRFMGRKHDEVAQEIGRVPYKVVRFANGDVQVDVRGKKYSPPEISAMILQKLKTAAENLRREDIVDETSQPDDAPEAEGVPAIEAQPEPVEPAPPITSRRFREAWFVKGGTRGDGRSTPGTRVLGRA